MIPITVTATLQSSVHLGTRNTAAYFLNSLDHIPGRALLGAAAWAWLDSGRSANAPEFHDRFLSGRASWGDLYPVPVDPDSGEALVGLPVVPPHTTMTCKLFGFQHRYFDTLLHERQECPYPVKGGPCGMGLQRIERGLFRRTIQEDQFEVDAVYEGVPDDWSSSLLRPQMRKQHRTHLAIGLHTGTARTGYLYSRETLREGQVFRGQLYCADAALADALIAELAAEDRPPLSVGGGRSRGYGQLELHASKDRCPAISATAINVHSAEIARSLRIANTNHGDTRDATACFFTLTAGSPWLLREADGGCALSLTDVWLQRALSLTSSQRAEVLDGESRTETRSGWDGAAGLPTELRHLISAGSTFVCKVQGLELADVQTRLTALLCRGIGAQRVEGLGRVVVNHPLHFISLGGQP